MLIPLVAVVAFVALWWFTASRTMFLVELHDGQLIVRNGRIPGSLRADFERIAAASPSCRGKVKACRQEDGARLVVSGNIAAGTTQRLRNAFGLYPQSRLRHASPIGRPTLARVGLVAWIAGLVSSALSR